MQSEDWDVGEWEQVFGHAQGLALVLVEIQLIDCRYRFIETIKEELLSEMVANGVAPKRHCTSKFELHSDLENFASCTSDTTHDDFAVCLLRSQCCIGR
jgi:hypothetical protein